MSFNDGVWRYGNKHRPGWNFGGHHVGRPSGPIPGGPFPGGNPNGNGPWVYKVPDEPDGSGGPSFQPNCGGNNQPPC